MPTSSLAYLQEDYYRSLAAHVHLPFVSLSHTPADQNLLKEDERFLYLSLLTIPIKQTVNQMTVATAKPATSTLKQIRKYWGPSVEIVVTSKFSINLALRTRFNDKYSQQIISDIFNDDVANDGFPEASKSKKTPLGSFLLSRGLVTINQLQQALLRQIRFGGKLGDILQANNSIRSLDYYQALAAHFQLPFVNLIKTPPDKKLLVHQDCPFYLSQQAIPIKYEADRFIVATANPGEETRAEIMTHFGQQTEIVITTKFDILWILQDTFDDTFTNEVINTLAQKEPELSARRTFTGKQRVVLTVLAIAFITLLLIKPTLALLLFNIILTLTICGTLTYKVFLAFRGLLKPLQQKQNTATLNEATLPIYTILVPLYQEKISTLTSLTTHLQALDYPAHKLDIKLILERDDELTISLVKSLHLPTQFENIYVPPSQPRTKPKACNYALKFARGEFVTIYDAEDRPESDQLKQVLAVFQKNEPGIECVQCHLNYYNSTENWLTRMFTLEYTFWYDLILPVLSADHFPIPLGGTSNHFRTTFLQNLAAWDPYNVTEDADLGMRLYRLGFRTSVAPSTTYEEANCHLGNWFKQRTRWVKGYMQTFLVHTRHPIQLFREIGFRGVLSMLLVLGGSFISNLANLFLVECFIIICINKFSTAAQLFPTPILEIAWFNFIAGSILMILLNMLAVIRRKLYSFILPAITAPFYWLLMSLASYRALWQLWFSPSKWEKTEHGISKTMKDEDLDK